MEQLKTIGRELAMGSQGSTWVGGHSKEFLDLVKSIGESRSKTEEDKIVLSELEILKVRLGEPDIPKRKMKEYIIRLIYVEMLGYDASFGYIHAVKMTHDDSLLLKRTGYLAVTLFLREDHDFIMLIINTIQKDLKSDNYLVACAALTAVCKLINEETIPAVLPQVIELLGHPKEAVRKKAIMALHRFHQRSAHSVTHLISNFRKRLCDSDPGVMGATLCPLFDVITDDTNSYKDLGMSFINILKQVAERKLPRSYDYHQMPAPFIQVKLLKILSLLGSGDRQASEGMYNVVAEVLRKCDSSSNIGNAVLYECICCISSIYPNPQLMEKAADAISGFLKSESHNLKYMGIDALARLMNTNPEYAEQHQLAVIDCLEDPDDTLKRKTFDLLYKMTKSSNVEIIVDRMIEYMISINDNHYKREIASRCVGVAEQFAPHNTWFIQTMTKVFRHAGDLVNAKVPHDLMRLIAEGFGEDAEDSLLQSSAVDSYLRIIGDVKIPSVFLQIICWVLGEYGTIDSKFTTAHISGKLCELAEAHANDDVVQAYAVTALMKVYAFELASGKKLNMLPECESYIGELSASHSTDLQQRAYELQALLSLDPNALNAVMPFNSSCEDITIEEGLPFLDDHVRKCLENGAQAYVPETARLELMVDGGVNDASSSSGGGRSLRFEAYDVPKPPPLVVLSDGISSQVAFPPAEEGVRAAAADPSSSSSSMKLRLEGVQKKWGRETLPVSVSGKTNGRVDKSRERTAQPRAISSEKQKLAASLFSGMTMPNAEENKMMKKKKTIQQPPPPDLLVFGDEEEAGAATAVDPFIAIDGDVAMSSSSYDGFDELLLLQGITSSSETGSSTRYTKGSDGSLARDAVARHAGVNPSVQNPHLFKDLLS